MKSRSPLGMTIRKAKARQNAGVPPLRCASVGMTEVFLRVSGFEGRATTTALGLWFGEVTGSPEVPAGDGAPWLPSFCAAMHDVGFGKIHGSDLVGGLE